MIRPRSPACRPGRRAAARSPHQVGAAAMRAGAELDGHASTPRRRDLTDVTSILNRLAFPHVLTSIHRVNKGSPGRADAKGAL